MPAAKKSPAKKAQTAKGAQPAKEAPAEAEAAPAKKARPAKKAAEPAPVEATADPEAPEEEAPEEEAPPMNRAERRAKGKGKSGQQLGREAQVSQYGRTSQAHAPRMWSNRRSGS